jgi:hypothetical protein
VSHDDELRAHQEHLRIGATCAGRQYLDPAKLSEELPEPYMAPAADADAAGLTHADVTAAIGELAEQAGTGFSEMSDWVQRSATGGSVGELVLAVAQVADELSLAATDYADPGYVREGHRRFPVDTPEKATRSWRELHEHHREYAAADFKRVHDAIAAALEGFGQIVHDPCDLSGGLTPEGTPSGQASGGGSAADTARLTRRAVGDELLGLAATLSASDRQELARKGQALDDGSYPVPDLEHLKAAAFLCRSKHGDWRAAEKLIARRAKELGVDNPLEHDGPIMTTAGTVHTAIAMAGAAQPEPVAEPLSWADAEVARLTADHADVIGLARGSGGQDSAESVVARHPELAHLFRRDGSRRHGVRGQGGKFAPARSGKPVTSATRAHASDLDEDPTDSRQPAKGGDVHPEVKRLLAEYADVVNYPPESADQREAREKRARAGHGPSTAIPELERRIRQQGSNTSYPPLPRS